MSYDGVRAVNADWSPYESTCTPGRYLYLECFSCGEVAESEGVGRGRLPSCSCGRPYSVETRERRGYPSLSVGLRRALYESLSDALRALDARALAEGRGYRSGPCRAA